MWKNGEWTVTYQVKDSDPVQIKGYSASIAVRETVFGRSGWLSRSRLPHQRSRLPSKIDHGREIFSVLTGAGLAFGFALPILAEQKSGPDSEAARKVSAKEPC
jgi:hypothetical protein